MSDRASATARLASLFQLREAGQEKVMTVDEALRRLVRPGTSLFLTRYAGAMVSGLIRAYTGSSPEFTLIALALRDQCLNLLATGLLKKVIIANAAYGYPTPAPIPLVQAACARGEISLEEWSVYSLNQRLQAGAQGYPFVPTRSLIGSDLAVTNRDSFLVIDDPFGTGPVGVVKSLTPDLALVHGCVADRYGNTILPLSHEDPIQGAWAARDGVIVSVERVVSTEFIRRHSAQVRIPGTLVRAVCPAPFGGHPNGVVNNQLADFEGYGADYDFMLRHREATKDHDALSDWVRQWVLSCSCHDDYLARLGTLRLDHLRHAARPDAWEESLRRAAASATLDTPCNSVEMMVVIAARKIAEIVEDKGYDCVLVGAGLAALASGMAYYQLQAKGCRLNLLLGSGLVSYAPPPGDPMFTSILNVFTAQMVATSQEVYGCLVGGPRSRTVSVLGTAQVDRHGNLNTSRLADPSVPILTGAGGANDAVNSCETLLLLKQSRSRYVEKVDYVSCPGERVKTVISDFGVFEKLDGELVLASVFPSPDGLSLAERVELVRARCGWELGTATSLREIQPPPSSEELTLLRALDPRGVFLGKQ